MPYKYSICHINRSKIEYPKNLLSDKEVKEMVLKYPWKELLKKLETMPKGKIHFSPSLEFTNLDNNYSFSLSAGMEKLDNFSFYIWYNRPVMKKILFGLMGEKEKFDLIDKWFSINDSYELLDKFLMKDYRAIERKMNEK